MLYNVPIECRSNARRSLVFQKCRLQGGSNGPQFMILFATLEVVFSWPDLVSPWGEIPVKDGIIQTPEASHTMTAHPWTSRAFLVLYFAERKRRIPFPFARKVNGCLRERAWAKAASSDCDTTYSHAICLNQQDTQQYACLMPANRNAARPS